MRFAYTPLQIAILSILSTNIYAQSNEITNEATAKLTTIVSQAEAEDTVGATVYSKKDIEKTPNSSKNITDFLKVNPSVQFNRNSRTGKNQGELSPQDISINGGLAYDNKFLINGINFNNNINPTSTAASNSNSDLKGSSQAVAINTDLLCNLTVLDSNVSAEYGEFLGGVVNATTCAPKTSVGELHGQINYDYTSDDWSRINFTNSEEQVSYENSSSENTQPQFTKQGVSANLYGNMTENLGFSLAAAQRWSKIPLNTIILEPNTFTQSRESNNISLEMFYTPSDQTKLKIGTQFFENSGEYFQSNSKNSQSQHQSDSQSFYINLQNDFEGLDLEQQINYQTQFADRNSAPHVYTWRYAAGSKDWANTNTVNEGSFGQFEQEEEKLEYSLKATLDPIVQGDWSHQIKIGAGYGHYEAYWKRNQNSYWYVGNGNLKGQSCVNANGIRYDGCDEALTNNNLQGQYFTTRTVYGAGELNIQQDRWHAYIEDTIKWNNTFFTTLGVRSDYDSITKETNLAPRSSFTYQPFNSPLLRLTTGWNRYYGLNTFANKLQANKRLLQTTETRTGVDKAWKTTAGSQYGQMSHLSKLESPISNEKLFAISGQAQNIDWSIKWVNRENKKMLRQSEWEENAKPEGKGNYTTYYYVKTSGI